MTDHSVIHETFRLERTYQASPARVFDAWSDPAAKAQWFAGPQGTHELDFRPGGHEVARGSHAGKALTFESVYHDIVPGERIVYASTLSADQQLATVSLTTVQFSAMGEATVLVLTEQGAFLDGLEDPVWRERGTSDQLDALGVQLGHQSAQR